MTYFKHRNYYKIQNKPVFYIHHPFEMSDRQLALFKKMMNNACINNGFDGVMLVVNNIARNYTDYYNYTIHPNYKQLTTLNYEQYIDKHLNDNNNVNTLFFDFNNSARLCRPNKLDLVSKIYNNSIDVQNKYVKKVLEQYTSNTEQSNNETTELNQTLLINSWNEWGENMAIEPGKKNKTKYLLLIKSNLISYL